jgi:hypothetical protein
MSKLRQKTDARINAIMSSAYLTAAQKLEKINYLEWEYFNKLKHKINLDSAFETVTGSSEKDED